MLALSPLRTSNADDQIGDSAGGGFSDPFLEDEVDFLDSIDFSGIFEGFGLDGIGVLPELQVACNILDDFSAGGTEEQAKGPQERIEENDVTTETRASSPSPVSSRGRKPEAAGVAKSSHGKKKGKVDWTPELHRRFEKAVEQLGVDKAVPSRILELMGTNNLTRHNVASHLQKYRCHRKHLLAREAEAASWSHRRQLSSVAKKEKSSSWISPTQLVFPPPPLRPPFRPLHVWGHPTVDHRPPMVPAMWPGNATIRSPAPHWPPQPPNYITYWQPHYQQGSREGWGPSALSSAPPCLPQPLPAIRFAPPPVTGVPPHHQMYRPPHWVPPLKKHPGLQPELSAYPSKESIDAAFGDVLAKPWLPLPLGLKPPSTESVLVELQRQGVSKVPPSAFNI